MSHSQGRGTDGTGRLIRIMTVDDHPIYRGGLAALIGAYPDFQLVAEATNGREALERFREHSSASASTCRT